MSENKGSLAATVTVTREPDRSGNFVCDGTADDVQINAAIVYVAALGGGLVHLGRGIYDITAPIVDAGADDITIEGSGKDTVLTTADTTAINTFSIEGGPGALLSGWVIRDLMIDGNKANNAWGAVGTNQIGIYFDYIRDSHITGVWITDTPGNGIYARRGGYNEIHANHIWNTGEDQHQAMGGNAIEIANDPLDTIWGNVIWSDDTTTPNGLFVSFCDRIIVGLNRIRAVGYAGIEFAQDTTQSVIVGNNISHVKELAGDGGLGIYISTNAVGHAITGNTIEYNEQHGILIFATSDGDSEDHTVVGNTIVHNTLDGVRISRDDNNVNNVLIESNTITDNGAYGINLFASQVQYTSAQNNKLVNNTSGCINDGGTETQLATLDSQFVLAGAGAAWVSGWGSTPSGIDVDADSEVAGGHVWLPPKIQQVVRVQIYAYARAAEAANNMLLQVVISGGSSSEGWATNIINLASHPSEETGGIAMNDVIHWQVDASDDSDLNNFVGGDLMEVLAIGEAAGAPDIATDGYFGTFTVEHV